MDLEDEEDQVSDSVQVPILEAAEDAEAVVKKFEALETLRAENAIQIQDPDPQWEEISSEEGEDLYVSTLQSYDQFFAVLASRTPLISTDFAYFLADRIGASMNPLWKSLFSALSKAKTNKTSRVSYDLLTLPQDCYKLCETAKKFPC